MPTRKLNQEQYSIPTRLLYGDSPAAEWDYSHHVVPPISASSTFRLESAERGAEGFAALGQLPSSEQSPVYVYHRMGEPTVNLLERGLATAEGAECALCFASGMAAIHAAVFACAQPGQKILSHKTIYGCTYSLFTRLAARFGIAVEFVDFGAVSNWPELVSPETRIIYLESPANPSLDLIDLDEISAKVRQINAGRAPGEQLLTFIDNTFATPFCQRPLSHGIDLVIHSLTKAISGFGTDLGGAIITRKELYPRLFEVRKDCGGIIAAATAWHILVYGLSTLTLRLPRQQANATLIAEFLSQHPQVEEVRYPGLPHFPQSELARRMLKDYEGHFAPGCMLYFTLKGKSLEDAKVRGRALMNFIANNSYTITLAVSLGQLRTLVEHPASMTHASYPANDQMARGIHPAGIRLALGVESPQDIIRDLEAALCSLGR